MKTLKEYIEESILDVDDLVTDDTLFIEKWLKENCKIDGSYTIKDGIVNVKGSVQITKNIKSIDIQFGKVSKDFNCWGCNSLTTLEGSPKEIDGNFSCSHCYSLTSLEGAPEKVKKNFMCLCCNSLTSLKGAPEKVDENFNCSYCPNLTSLEGAPKEVGGNFDCTGCPKLKK